MINQSRGEQNRNKQVQVRLRSPRKCTATLPILDTTQAHSSSRLQVATVLCFTLHLLSLFCTELELVMLVSAVSRPPPPPRSACWPQHKARPVLACLLTARLRLAQFCKLAKSLAKYPFCPRNSELCVLSRKYLHWLPSTSAKLSKTSVSQRSAQNIDCAENGKHI